MRQSTRIASKDCATTNAARRYLVFKQCLRFCREILLSTTPKLIEREGDSGLAQLLREAGRCTRAKYIVILIFYRCQYAAIESACAEYGQSAVAWEQPDAR